ncbi:MAG: acyl-CoA synthetase, partial [Deltaproteobacteria bacterium]|nr:acyl-CoA synthetase [Deltaproteobacteria bacterium]
EIFIIEQVPLTPVGKIFKPALRWEAIKQVYRKELEVFGDMVDSVDVKVREDKVHGSLAVIIIKPAPQVSNEEIEGKVNQLLTRYTVKYSLEVI